jgi:hypothetical protein
VARLELPNSASKYQIQSVLLFGIAKWGKMNSRKCLLFNCLAEAENDAIFSFSRALLFSIPAVSPFFNFPEKNRLHLLLRNLALQWFHCSNILLLLKETRNGDR